MHSSKEQKKGHKLSHHEQLKQYNQSRKAKGVGKNRFDDVDTKVYYGNALGTTEAADIKMTGGFMDIEDNNNDDINDLHQSEDLMKTNRTSAQPSMQQNSKHRERVSIGDNKRRLSETPIIIVPSGYNTIISKLNVKHFLEDGKVSLIMWNQKVNVA